VFELQYNPETFRDVLKLSLILNYFDYDTNGNTGGMWCTVPGTFSSSRYYFNFPAGCYATQGQTEDAGVQFEDEDAFLVFAKANGKKENKSGFFSSEHLHALESAVDVMDQRCHQCV
jgi:hypothetical protein